MGNFLDQRAQVLRTFSETPSAPRLGVPPAGRGSTPGGRPDRRAAEGVDFPLKNKVEGLSPSTPRMVRQVWPHLRTTLGLALPSPRRAGRYPPEF